MVAHWHDPDFVAAAESWIRDTVVTAGSAAVTIDRVHTQEWSTVWRIETGADPLWFKANSADYHAEADVIAAVAACDPLFGTEVIAVEPQHRWLLMRDAGASLREEIDEEGWVAGFADVLPRYAEVQLGSRAAVEGLVAAGVRRVDVTTLSERYAALVEPLGDPDLVAAAARLPHLLEVLAGVPIPDMIQHDDLHDGQIFRQGQHHRLLDWGDSVISHPFFSLSVCLQGVAQWGLEDIEGSVDTTPLLQAYLVPFEREFGPRVHDVVPAALQLGWVVRALNGLGDESPDRLRARLSMFAQAPPLV
jgi:Phosphotransferase enzyme family